MNQYSKKSRWVRRLVFFVVSVFIIYGVYLGGYWSAKRGVAENIIPGPLINLAANQPKEIDFSLFWDVWNKAHREYYHSIDDQKMVYGAINGALGSLSDPYTIFLTPEMNRKFKEELAGQFEGIGAELSIKNNRLVIVAPLEDSPAAKAGLLASDIIAAIDNQKTDSMTLDQAVDLIRGQKGTKVTLSIIRGETTKDYEVTREEIIIKSVKSEFKKEANKEIGVLRISQFAEDTASLVDKFADQCLAKNCSGIIIDLRNNPGGLLESAIDVGSIFVKDGVIVKEVTKDGSSSESRTTRSAKLSGKKIIVLINGGSASASEILAGALEDYNLAVTIGEKTFGKGSVQSIEDLKNESALKVTIAEWLTPKGRKIDKVGLSPNIEIKLSEDDTNAGRDPQMDTAIKEVVK